jgi:hypothetical protein
MITAGYFDPWLSWMVEFAGQLNFAIYSEFGSRAAVLAAPRERPQSLI